jgi:hypothetical protein
MKQRRPRGWSASGLKDLLRMSSDSTIAKGMIVIIGHDYDVFGTNVNGMNAVVIRPYSVDRMEGPYKREKRVIKHLVYVEGVDEYCEPRHEWLRIVNQE